MMKLDGRKIYLYSKDVDFRKGISSLNNLIQIHFKDQELDDCLFLFFSKNARQIKIIEIEKDGTWLYQKKLYDSKFIFAKADHTICIDKEKLRFILSSTQKIQRRSRY